MMYLYQTDTMFLEEWGMALRPTPLYLFWRAFPRWREVRSDASPGASGEDPREDEP